MNNSDTTILTVFEKDIELLDLMIRSVYKFSDVLSFPRILICDYSNAKEAHKTYKNDNNIRVFRKLPSAISGSMKHGHGLNFILPSVKTKKTAIIESDCILLSTEWDKLDQTKFKIKAAQKAKNKENIFYHVCFMVFETEVLRGISFLPGKDGNIADRSYAVHEDVGWRIGLNIKDSDVLKMQFVDCKTGKGKYFDKRFQSDEIWHDETPIIAHFGRGSNICGKAIRKGFSSPKEQLKEWKKIAEGIV